jgi:hypothetical protein
VLKLKLKTTPFPLKFSSNRLWQFLKLTQLTRLYSRYIYIYIYIKSKINMGVCQIWINTVPTYYFIRWGENPYINQRGVAGLVGISINSRSKRVSLVKRGASTILSVLKSLLCFLFFKDFDVSLFFNFFLNVDILLELGCLHFN